MEIYLYIVAAVLIFGVLLPQHGPKRKYYIWLMTAIHTFVTGFRYMFLTGDLRKYYSGYMARGSYGWLSNELLAGGRNSGFFILNKIVNLLSGGDFQVFLIVLALTTYIILGYVIYRYSTAPWLSYLVWNCMAFFIFGLSAIKQALAMALVMLAFVGVAERKLWLFLSAMALAGSVHMPALIFLPAYWVTSQRINGKMILLYLALGLILCLFPTPFVRFIQSFYYEDDELYIHATRVGGRAIMIIGFTLFSLLLTGLQDRTYEKLFHLMAVAAILQMLGGVSNIFTRLTDYYFQFSVLYLPMLVYPERRKPMQSGIRPVFPFNKRSRRVIAAVLVAYLLWFYWSMNLNITISYQVDNYLDFRFMWDVK